MSHQVPLRVSPIITPKELGEKMNGAANIRVVDGTWHMCITGFGSGKKNPQQEYYRDHIPGALFFDIDACSDKNSPYPDMLPSAEQFEEHVSKLGISNHTHVIVYDNNTNFGMFSASRVWWMFRVFGHNLVSVLDGGLPRWEKEGYYTTDDVDKVPPGTFKARLNPKLLKTYEEMEGNLSLSEIQVIDARPASRFDGSGSEPTPGVKPGHMPNAINIPFTRLLDPKEKRLKSKAELLDVFDDAGVNMTKPAAAMCGKGLVAPLLLLAAFICDKKDGALYDGSWVEWFLRSSPEQKIDVPK